MCGRHNQQDIDGRLVHHQLRIRLLGDFQVTIGDRSISDGDWRLANAAALVKLLALAPGQGLHREQLVDILWPESTPAAAANSLRYALHIARRTLDPDQPPDGHLLQSRAGWLSLDAGSDIWIDVEAFEHAAAAAEREADPEAYYRALDFYAGDLLPRDRYEEWTIERRDGLRRRRLGLLRGLARLHLERGDLDLALATLQRVVEIEPVDEDAHVQLMSLLGRLGLRHQAQLQYERLQEALACGLDARPGPAARQVYRDLISRQDPAGDSAWIPRRASRVAPKVRGERETNLPAALTRFVGREPEITELVRTVQAQRLVTLTGPGGAGKTRLALRVAEALVEPFPDGIWLVDLSGTTDPHSIPQQIATALNVRDQVGHSLDETISLHLRDRWALLIVDNCEHLLDACASFIYDLLRACRALHILATSRELLRVPGEVVREVWPLSFPEPGQVSGASPEDYEAVNLFVERAKLVRPDFRIAADTIPAVVEICRKLDGMPLAIELAAARMRMLALDDIVARLGSPYSLLDKGSPYVPQRHQSLRAAVDWSFGLLPDADRILARRLAVFSGGWTIDGAISVAAGDGVSDSEVADLVAGLVDKSLVKVVDGDEPGRYRFLETIRQYALEQLDQSGESATTQLRHGEYFMRLAEESESRFRGPEQARWLAWWRREQDNVRAALAYLIASGQRRESLRFSSSLWRFWVAGGQFSEGRRWFARLFGDGDLEPTTEAMRASFGDGRLAYAQGDFPGALARFSESLQLARRLQDPDFAAGSLVQLGHVAVREGDYATARMRYEAGLIIRRQQGDGWYLAVVLDGLGQVSAAEGDYVAARDYYEDSLALYQRSGDHTQVARSLALLGHLDYLSGDFRAARVKLAESLAKAQVANNKQGMALAFAGLGHVAAAHGDAGGSSRLFERSRNLYERVGARRAVATEIDALAWPPETGQSAVASQRPDRDAVDEFALGPPERWRVGRYPNDSKG